MLIGIIVILAALLTPALQSAHESALRSSCANNQRQTGLGISAYTQDNRGFLPYTYTTFNYHEPMVGAWWNGVDYEDRPHGLGVLYIDYIKYYRVQVRHNSYATQEHTLCTSNGFQFSYGVPRARGNNIKMFADYAQTAWRVPSPKDTYIFFSDKGPAESPWRVAAACFFHSSWQQRAPHKNRGTNLLYHDGAVAWSPNPDFPLWKGFFYAKYTSYTNCNLVDSFWHRVNFAER